MEAKWEVILVPKLDEAEQRAAIGEAIMLARMRERERLLGIRPMFINLENPVDGRFRF